MSKRSILVVVAAALFLPPIFFATQASAQVTLFDRENFEGQPLTTSQPRIESTYANSIMVMDEHTWVACDRPNFHGVCVRLTPMRYPSPASMGLRSTVASIRMIDDGYHEPQDSPRDNGDYQRRSGERLYDVPVANIRAVPGQNPAHWEVTYFFRGREHRVRMEVPPGPTIRVNESGEPRA